MGIHTNSRLLFSHQCKKKAMNSISNKTNDFKKCLMKSSGQLPSMVFAFRCKLYAKE